MTVTNPNTLQKIMDGKSPSDIGIGLATIEEDSGTISAATTYKLNYPATSIDSIRVVTSGTAGAVGVYHASDSGVTPLAPYTAGGGGGVCKVGTDAQTLTFPNTVTRVIVRYRPKFPFSPPVGPH
jgi:hypothetical protein